LLGPNNFLLTSVLRLALGLTFRVIRAASHHRSIIAACAAEDMWRFVVKQQAIGVYNGTRS
jgi:hypothetical protein